MTPEQLADEANQLAKRLATSPNNVELINNLASIRRRQGFIQAAIAGFQLALQIRPDLAVVHYNLGNAYAEAGQSEDGISAYQQAIHYQPHFPEAYQNLGDLLNKNGEFEQAIVCYQRSLELRPESLAVLSNLGNALVRMGEYHSAENYLRRAQALSPNIPEVYNNLGRVFLELNQMTAAEQAFRTAITLAPNLYEAYVNLSGILALRNQHEQSLELLDHACALQPNESSVLLGLIFQMQQVCQWDRLPQLCDRFSQLISKNNSNHPSRQSELPSPLIFMSLPIVTTAEQQLRCSRNWASTLFPHSKSINQLPPDMDRLQSKEPIRIGYLSSDFHDHPIGYLVPELFENHNRNRFQVFGYSLGVDLSGDVHARIVRSFDSYRDLNQLSISQAAQTIANDKIDILVDLQAYTSRARPAILALRPAPIQINYLGFAGTMGAEFIDYILVDEYVVPSSQQEHYQEKLIQLPQSFMVQDSKRAIDEMPQSRANFGLPENAIVLAAFSRSFKITPSMFDCWLRILKAIPNSVLWMKSWSESGEKRLRIRAERLGLEKNRLIFSPSIPMPSHLACHRLADLYLDTFPYNQHSTAADALRVGLPLLTLQGETFASRVSASFLVKLGLPELVANSMEEYETIAIRLATKPDTLSALRNRLEAALQSTDLFDGCKFATKVEKAYELIWKNYHLGHKPRLIRSVELSDG